MGHPVVESSNKYLLTECSQMKNGAVLSQTTHLVFAQVSLTFHKHLEVGTDSSIHISEFQSMQERALVSRYGVC